ncbi:MAG: ATP phosphoribosyltransferase regulatory subunit [Clostridia bacterium]|nr:ATP phosphoribosyltransferase regulatory subunit [Clostridia bacterium]
MNNTYLKPEERAVFALRSLYRGYGYLPFKMSKFEEYDLYVRNKDFLVSDRIITFTDVEGKLLALAPDVTLSIIKNGEDRAGEKQKVCYNENVYRVSGSTHRFKEILQTGLECIGDLDSYDVCEVVTLAAASLATVSDSYALDISHMGILSAMLDEITADGDVRREIARCVSEKNTHDLARVCAEAGVSPEDTDNLCGFVGIYGDMDTVLARLSPLARRFEAVSVAISELTSLRDHLKSTPYADRVRFDFSIMNDMSYYNGVVFCGYLDGICECVLSGGQYNKLMKRMGRKAGAIGFALYLDLLEGLAQSAPAYDVDTLVLYDAATPTEAVSQAVAALRSQGKSVSAQRAIPEKLRYATLCDLRKEGAK